MDPSNNEEEKTEAQKLTDLATLKAIEDVVNEGAAPLAKLYHIPDGRWAIKIVERRTMAPPIMWVKGGTNLEIILECPKTKQEYKDLKEKLRGAFKLAVNRGLLQSMAVQTVMYIKKAEQESKKWLKRDFDDASEIITELVPKFRLEQIVETKVTLRDSKTGLSVSHTVEKKGHFQQDNMKQWIELSRMVREVDLPDMEPDEETDNGN